MRPAEVLDAQADLIERLGGTGSLRGHVDSFFKADMREAKTDLVPSEILRRDVEASYAYRVTHDMSMLVEHAANGLDDLDQFDRSLAPTGCGIVYFERPLPVKDIRGKTMLVHWLVWAPIGVNAHHPKTGRPRPVVDHQQVATVVWTFNDTWTKPDEVADLLWADIERDHGKAALEKYQRDMGRWAMVGVDSYFDEQRLGPAILQPSEDQAARVLATGGVPHEGSNPMRYLHALWLLLNQTVTSVAEEYPERAARRRAVKKRIPPKVTVIRLRREEKHGERKPGESDVEWAHRWVVRGHWRWQRCGEAYPGAQETEPGEFRSRIWINPYVKGPEDQPIKQSEKVYSLDR